MIDLAAFLLAQAISLEAAPGQPTARDMYVACLLFVNRVDVPPDSHGTRQTYAASHCSIDDIPEGASRNGRAVRNRDLFCLPHSAEIDSNPGRAMALAYIDNYRRVGWASPSFDGARALVEAMVNTWPCHRPPTANSAQANGIERILRDSTTVATNYFDPYRERRSPTSAGSIDDNFDIENTVRCDGITCFGALRLLQGLLIRARRVETPCRTPNYARIEFSGGRPSYTMHIDYTGRSVTLGNQYFTLSDNMIWSLRRTPVGDW